jgi:hypothetical protein
LAQLSWTVGPDLEIDDRKFAQGLGNPRLHLGISEPRIDLFVELVDDFEQRLNKGER